MNYEDFFSAEDVATFKRVKKGQMRLARVARREAACLIGVPAPKTAFGSGKEFLVTPKGTFRLSIGSNSDNTTEQAAHDEMGAIPVVMGDPEDMQKFFALHGLRPEFAYMQFRLAVGAAL